MKLQPEKSDSQIITAYGAGWVSIGWFENGQPKTEKITHSVALGSHGERLDWPDLSFEQLSAEHFDKIAHFKPELLIFGSGAKMAFPSPKLYQTLIQARIGIEVMDTLAACRTYNILAGEGRHVLAFLLLN